MSSSEVRAAISKPGTGEQLTEAQLSVANGGTSLSSTSAPLAADDFFSHLITTNPSEAGFDPNTNDGGEFNFISAEGGGESSPEWFSANITHPEESNSLSNFFGFEATDEALPSALPDNSEEGLAMDPGTNSSGDGFSGFDFSLLDNISSNATAMDKPHSGTSTEQQGSIHQPPSGRANVIVAPPQKSAHKSHPGKMQPPSPRLPKGQVRPAANTPQKQLMANNSQQQQPPTITRAPSQDRQPSISSSTATARPSPSTTAPQRKVVSGKPQNLRLGISIDEIDNFLHQADELLKDEKSNFSGKDGSAHNAAGAKDEEAAFTQLADSIIESCTKKSKSVRERHAILSNDMLGCLDLLQPHAELSAALQTHSLPLCYLVSEARSQLEKFVSQ